VADCEEQADGHSYIYRVDVLVQAAGVFHHVLDITNYTGVDVIAGIDDAGGDARSNSLSRAEVAGSVVRDTSTKRFRHPPRRRPSQQLRQSFRLPRHLRRCPR
jgi:hypothetical protein